MMQRQFFNFIIFAILIFFAAADADANKRKIFLINDGRRFFFQRWSSKKIAFLFRLKKIRFSFDQIKVLLSVYMCETFNTENFGLLFFSS